MNWRAASSSIGVAAAGIAAALLLGCSDDAAPASPPSDTPQDSTDDPRSEAFRTEAHAKALASLRETSTPVLRLLDPVAAAVREQSALRVPRVGPAARTSLRKPLELAQREAAGIKPQWLSPTDGVVFHVHVTGLDRGFEHQRSSEARDGPRGVLYTLEPYLEQLDERLARGQCDDGCGIEGLAPALRASFAEVGAAAPATIAAARQDFAALGARVQRWTTWVGAEHPVAVQAPALATVLAELDAALVIAEAAVPQATALPWDAVAPGSEPAEWKQRPNRWGPERLRGWLQTEEAYGHPPQALFERVVGASERLQAMRSRKPGTTPATSPLDRPWTTAVCETSFAPLATWVEAQQSHLEAEVDCDALVRTLGPEPTDIEIMRALIGEGIIAPTRQSLITSTPVDLGLVWGRAAPATQRLTLEVAIAAGTGHPLTGRAALDEAHHSACLAATAVWIHGKMGPDDLLRQRIGTGNCDDVDGLIAEAEARPRRALRGLGWILLGQGPADAAALDRYWWAPMGLVRDLAIPPPPPVEAKTTVKIEELN